MILSRVGVGLFSFSVEHRARKDTPGCEAPTVRAAADATCDTLKRNVPHGLPLKSHWTIRFHRPVCATGCRRQRRKVKPQNTRNFPIGEKREFETTTATYAKVWINRKLTKQTKRYDQRPFCKKKKRKKKKKTCSTNNKCPDSLQV